MTYFWGFFSPDQKVFKTLWKSPKVMFFFPIWVRRNWSAVRKIITTAVGEVRVYLIDVNKYSSHKPTGRNINSLTDDGSGYLPLLRDASGNNKLVVTSTMSGACFNPVGNSNVLSLFSVSCVATFLLLGISRSTEVRFGERQRDTGDQMSFLQSYKHILFLIKCLSFSFKQLLWNPYFGLLLDSRSV